MSNIEDIKNWEIGLPVASIWNTGGFIFSWHVDQTKNGLRLIPSIKLPPTNFANGEKLMQMLDQNAEFLKYVSDNNLPLILRDAGQLAQRMLENRGEYGNSPVQWRIAPDGRLDSTPFCDPFASTSYWSAEGTSISNTGFVKKLQEICPNPLWIGLWDNNEVGYPNVKFYMNEKLKKWKTFDELTAISLTMRQYVYGIDGQGNDVGGGVGGDSDPYLFWPIFFQLRKAHYYALYDAFKSGWSTWSGKKLIPVGYSTGAFRGFPPPPEIDAQIGSAPEAVCYDGAGPSFYPGNFHPYDLMHQDNVSKAEVNIVAWDQNKVRNPNAFRTVFLSIAAKIALRPAVEMLHEVSSPDIFQAYSEWVAWLIRKPGEPVLLQHWIGNNTAPTQLFFDGEESEMLSALGREDLLDKTHGDYALAVVKACDRICSEKIREFWLSGETIPHGQEDSDYRLVIVKSGDKALIFAWSAKNLSGKISVNVHGFGDFEIDSPSMGAHYWLIAPPPTTGFIVTKIG